jgi:hypothetical protein
MHFLSYVVHLKGFSPIFVLWLIFDDKNYNKFNNFCSFDPKIMKQPMLCASFNKGFPMVPEAYQGKPMVWEG